MYISFTGALILGEEKFKFEHPTSYGHMAVVNRKKALRNLFRNDKNPGHALSARADLLARRKLNDLGPHVKPVFWGEGFNFSYRGRNAEMAQVQFSSKFIF